MAIAFIRLFSLALRVFARPVLDLTKKGHIRNNQIGKINNISKKIYIALGNYCYHCEMKLNRAYSNIQGEEEIFKGELSEIAALEKGIGAFYEFLFYFLLFIVPIIEMKKMSEETKKRQSKVDQRIEKIERESASKEETKEKIHGRIEETKKRLEEVLNGLRSLQSEQIRNKQRKKELEETHMRVQKY